MVCSFLLHPLWFSSCKIFLPLLDFISCRLDPSGDLSREKAGQFWHEGTLGCFSQRWMVLFMRSMLSSNLFQSAALQSLQTRGEPEGKPTYSQFIHFQSWHWDLSAHNRSSGTDDIIYGIIGMKQDEWSQSGGLSLSCSFSPAWLKLPFHIHTLFTCVMIQDKYLPLLIKPDCF